MAKYIQYPFAVNGDRQPVPDGSAGGNVSYQDGYTPDYALPKTDPSRKTIGRQPFNQILNDVTANIKEWQQQMFPEFILDDGLGNLYSYPITAVVRSGGVYYQAKVDATTTAPPSAEWRVFSASSEATPGSQMVRGETGSEDEGTTKVADATEDQHPVTLGQLEAEVLSFSDLQWLGTAVREYKIMHITDLNQLPETDNPLYRYVLLSADQAGVGDYNEGVLINQATDSSSGREDITAEINLPASPMHGQTVRLVNSMEAFFKAGELAGAFSADQMQLLTGDFSAGSNSGFVGTSVRSGVFSDLGDAFGDNVLATQAGSPRKMAFDSSNSPDARTSATTEGATEPLNVTTVALLRIL